MILSTMQQKFVHGIRKRGKSRATKECSLRASCFEVLNPIRFICNRNTNHGNQGNLPWRIRQEDCSGCQSCRGTSGSQRTAMKDVIHTDSIRHSEPANSMPTTPKLFARPRDLAPVKLIRKQNDDRQQTHLFCNGFRCRWLGGAGKCRHGCACLFSEMNNSRYIQTRHGCIHAGKKEPHHSAKHKP